MKSLLKLIKKILIIIIVIFICLFAYICYQGYSIYQEAISKTSISQKVENIKGNSDYLSLKYIPKTYQEATVAIEDHRFYSHHGIDIFTTIRSLISNIQNKDLSNGGSSITQQVAKNMYFSSEKKFSRKVAELLVALDLEKSYSKDDILEIYLNIIYFGSGYTGISQASYGYFEKNPLKLTLSEQTLLAGLPNAPSVYSPDSNPELSKKRQKQVIDAMVKYGYITEDDANRL